MLLRKWIGSLKGCGLLKRAKEDDDYDLIAAAATAPPDEDEIVAI